MDAAVQCNLEQLYNNEMIPHMSLLYNYALRLTNNVDDAKDLIQDTYLKAYRFIDKYERDTNAKAWLFRILKNSFINNYRKNSRTPVQVEYSEGENSVDAVKDESAPITDMRNDIYDNMLGDDVVSALESLNEEFRTIIILSDIEEMTYEEIAEILEIPLGTVRSRLHRARNAMHQKLYHFALKHGFITKKTAAEFKPARMKPSLKLAAA